MLSLIAALTQRRVIGYQHKMPWHLPADLQHFKKITLGKTVIMGHNTFKSIGQPLPGRRNVVLTRTKDLTIPGCEIFNDLEELLSTLATEDEAFIIGGAHLYAQTLARVDRMYLTMIEADVLGDTYFPVWDEPQWQMMSEVLHPADANNAYPCRFVMYQRVIES